jgi:HD-GYP domain-containing protein (c-di-GMP phosphodiesterase class II)
MTTGIESSLTLLRRLAIAVGVIGVGFGLAFGWAVGGPRAGLVVLVGTVALYAGLLGPVRSALKTLTDQQQVLQEAFDGTIQSLAAVIEARDASAGDHNARVSHWALTIARALGLSGDDIRVVTAASHLHDLGKIGVPDQLLLKPGTLDEQEWAAVRRHALAAHRILEPMQIDERIKLGVRHSHERWDGSGYPDGLAGQAIPIHARLLTVAEAYVAMTSDRPYRKAMEIPGAIEELRRGAGSQFDPDIVDAFLTVLEQEGVNAWRLGPVIGRR